MYTPTRTHTYARYIRLHQGGMSWIWAPTISHPYVSWPSTSQGFAMEQSVKPLQEQLGLRYTFAQVPLCLCELISGLEAYSSLCLSPVVRDTLPFSLCLFHTKSEHVIWIWMSGYNLLVVLLIQEDWKHHIWVVCIYIYMYIFSYMDLNKVLIVLGKVMALGR